MRVLFKYPQEFNSRTILVYRALVDYSKAGISDPTYSELESQTKMGQATIRSAIQLLVEHDMAVLNGREKYIPEFLSDEQQTVDIPTVEVVPTGIGYVQSQACLWFTVISDIRPHNLITPKDYKAFTERWKTPIKEIYGQVPGAYVNDEYVFNRPQLATLYRIMRSALQHLVRKDLDFRSPASLVNTSYTILQTGGDAIRAFQKNETAVENMMNEVDVKVAELLAKIKQEEQS